MAFGGLPFFFFVWAAAGKGKKPKAVAEQPKPVHAAPPPMPGPAKPWPQVVPEGLPPFPSSGWVPDIPLGAGVAERAAQLIPVLWRHGIGYAKTEQTKGRWITYVARMHGPKRAVEAYRLATEAPVVAPKPPPAPKPAPTPSPAPQPQPSAPVEPETELSPTERQTLAMKLAAGLAGVPKGKENQGLVAAYQKAAGIVETGPHPMYGPTVAYALARDGVVPPSPLYWPKEWNKANKAIADWKAFASQQAALESDETRRLAWEESARGARMVPNTPYSATNLAQAASVFFQG